MYSSEARGSGSRRGSRGRSSSSMQWVARKSELPVTVDWSLDELSGNMGSGSRGRRKRTPSFSSTDSSGHANDDEVNVKDQVPVENVGPEEKGLRQQRQSLEDETGFTKRQPVMKSGDDKILYQSFTFPSINPCGGSSVSRNENKSGTGLSCDLQNQNKDVSLSYYESVSYKGGLGVDIVEDHKDAHKSGGAGKSLKESSMRPFDLFLKKSLGLKPGLKELNREKRKLATGYTGIVLRPGMVLLKNYLSINDQVLVVNKCRELGVGEGGFYQPGYQDGAVLLLKMMCLGKNWDPQTSQYGETRPVDGSTPPQIPVEFIQIVEKAIKESQSLDAINSKKMKGEDEIPFMSPDICIVNFYTTTGRLGLHQDKDESEKSIRKGLPVVSFSIGDSAEFLYGDKRDSSKAENVLLESGDVLLFGGKSRKIFHGVRSILKDTAPKVLVQETNLRPGRLNLTFRQY